MASHRGTEQPARGGQRNGIFGPLRSYETVIRNTTNRGGLVVRARLDRRRYPIGKRVSKKELREINIERSEFHGAWNYVIKPREQSRP